MKVSKNYKLKQRLKTRDGNKCWRCKRELSYDQASKNSKNFAIIDPIDPFLPRTFENTRLSCRQCKLDIGQEIKQGRSSFKEPKKIKNRLRKRDGDSCWICGITMNFNHTKQNDPSMATIDHIIEKFCGGTNSMSNLKLACKKCNDSRSSTKAYQILKKIKKNS